MLLISFFVSLWNCVSPLVFASPSPNSAFAQAFHGRHYGIISQGNLADERAVGKLNLLLFTEGRPSREFTYFAQGASGNIRVHQKASLHIKAVSSHLYANQARLNPLDSTEPTSSEHRFVRLGSSIEFNLPFNLSWNIGAAQDIAGSRANTLETDLSWWSLLLPEHPLRLGLGIAQDDNTHIRLHNLNVDLKLGSYRGMSCFLSAMGQLYADGLLGNRKEGRISGGIVAAQESRGAGFKLGAGGGAHGPFADLAFFYLFAL
jgi:hypothetical protein